MKILIISSSPRKGETLTFYVTNLQKAQQKTVTK